MKKIIISALAVLLATTALAVGPYHTNVVACSSAAEDLVIDVPAGKAIEIINFVDTTVSTTPSQIRVTISGNTAQALFASEGNADTPNSKNVIIDGPARVVVDGVDTQRCFLSYRLFTN